MLRTIIALFVVVAVAGLMAATVSARSVKIHERTIEVTESASSFTVTGKATGLAGGFTYEVEATGTISGSFQCRNPGGNDPPPQAFTAAVAGSGQFVAQKNGNLTFEVTVQVPTPTGQCPNPNWTAVVTSYSGTVTINIWDVPRGAQPLATVTGVAVSFP